MNRVKPDQLINLWVHMYDLKTFYGFLNASIKEHDHWIENMGNYWQTRVRNWRDLEPIDDSPPA